MDARSLIELESRRAARNYAPLDVVLAKGEGCWVEDVEGRRYLDCLSAYGAVNQGHCHPRILKALVEQASRLTLTSRAFRNDRFAPLCRKLGDLLGFDRVLLMNTGAEAVETAIKAARKWGYTKKGIPEGRAEILVFEGNFHGRTTTIVGFSSDPESREGFGPFAPGFTALPFGDLEAVEAAFAARGPGIAAVLVEPIQGEAGVILPPDDFLPGIRALCDTHRALLICDEIQSGLGRAGSMAASLGSGVRPDALTIGKALSGGFYPVSAFLADEEVMEVFGPGTHGSTYGGNPLASAIAEAALDVLVDEDLCGNSRAMGAQLHEGILALRSPKVAEIRAAGLWIGLDLEPSAGTARAACEELARHGVLAKDTHGRTIRLAPPLVAGPEEIDFALSALSKVL